MNTFFLLIVSIITRITFLFIGFDSITHDQADYFISGYILNKTGTDLMNNKFFLTSGIISVISSVPVYISSFFYNFLPKTVFFSKLPFEIIISLLPVFIYIITYRLTKNYILSLMVFLTTNFSPWFIYTPHVAFDSPIACTFYFASIYFLIKINNKISKYLTFFIFLFLSFNSYMGIKTSFFILVLIAFLIKDIIENKIIDLKNFTTKLFYSFLLFSVLTTFSLLSSGHTYLKIRAFDDVVFLNKNYLENQVWYERLTSTAPDFIKKILFNKATVSINYFLNNLIIFDPKIFFFKGDSHPIYGNNYFGLFYLWQFIFFIIGLINIKNVFNKFSFKILLLIILFFIAGAIPNGIQLRDSTIAIRGYILIFPYSLIIASGLYYIYKKFKFNPKLILLLNIISVIFFLFFFQYKIKIASSEQIHFSEKILTEKIAQEKSRYKKIYVYLNEPKETMLLYNFYQNKDGNSIKKSLIPKSNTYTIENIIFTNKIPDKNLTLKKDNLYLVKRTNYKNNNFEVSSYIDAIDKSGVVYYKIEDIK